jgi:hypothetical protein
MTAWAGRGYLVHSDDDWQQGGTTLRALDATTGAMVFGFAPLHPRIRSESIIDLVSACDSFHPT